MDGVGQRWTWHGSLGGHQHGDVDITMSRQKSMVDLKWRNFAQDAVVQGAAVFPSCRHPARAN